MLSLSAGLRRLRRRRPAGEKGPRRACGPPNLPAQPAHRTPAVSFSVSPQPSEPPGPLPAAGPPAGKPAGPPRRCAIRRTGTALRRERAAPTPGTHFAKRELAALTRQGRPQPSQPAAEPRRKAGRAATPVCDPPNGHCAEMGTRCTRPRNTFREAGASGAHAPLPPQPSQPAAEPRRKAGRAATPVCDPPDGHCAEMGTRCTRPRNTFREARASGAHTPGPARSGFSHTISDASQPCSASSR